MDMATENLNEVRRGPGRPRGRKDANKQEAVIEIGVVRDNLTYLEGLYRATLSAGVEFNDGVKKIAEKSGLMASVVSKYVKARVKDKAEDRKREAEQLSLLFDDTVIQ